MAPSERIHEARKQRMGLTQRELAALLDIEPSSLSRWERGVSEPRAHHLREIARLAKVPIAWFYEDAA